MMLLPLSHVTPIRIRSKVALAQPGLFWNFRKGEGPLLAFNWDNEPRLMPLEGKFAFHHFPLQLGHSMPGILHANVTFWVDIESRYDAATAVGPVGALIVSEGLLHVTAIQSGDRFGDADEVPLWGSYPAGTAEIKMGYTRWQIIAREGNDLITLWSSTGMDEMTDS